MMVHIFYSDFCPF